MEYIDDIEALARNRPVYSIFRGKQLIGYAATIQEADAICEKNHSLTWDKMKNINNKTRVELLTIND